MPPENPTVAEPAELVSAEAPAIAAPRREKRLVPVAPAPKRPPVAAVRVPKPPAAGQPAQVSAIERKVAGLHDPDEMLNVVRTEAALRRAQRLSGAGEAQRQTMRLLSVFMLFALLVAALGAMWYLQTSLRGSHRGAHRPPVPMPSASPR